MLTSNLLAGSLFCCCACICCSKIELQQMGYEKSRISFSALRALAPLSNGQNQHLEYPDNTIKKGLYLMSLWNINLLHPHLRHSNSRFLQLLSVLSMFSPVFLLLGFPCLLLLISLLLMLLLFALLLLTDLWGFKRCSEKLMGQC